MSIYFFGSLFPLFFGGYDNKLVKHYEKKYFKVQ